MKNCALCGQASCKNPSHEIYTKKTEAGLSKIEVIGFYNGWGESNCFLNSALQIM